MVKRKKKTALPRVTLLAYSSRELLRFSDMVECGAQSGYFIGELAKQLGVLLTRAEQLVARLEARAAAATKANRTRKAAAARAEGDQAEGGDPGPELPLDEEARRAAAAKNGRFQPPTQPDRPAGGAELPDHPPSN